MVGYIWLKTLDYLWCVLVLHQISFVPSNTLLRNAVVNEILKKGDVKSVCEIGGGYGGVVRYIARKCNADVVSLENMIFTCFIAKIASILPGGSKVQNIRVDAFKYLKMPRRKFDVGVAYLGPAVNEKLVDVMHAFNVLIVLDVPIPYVEPAQVVDLGHGFTRYGRLKFPHKLFVYKN